MSHRAVVELYPSTETIVPSAVEELLRTLHNNDIDYIKINVFNIKSNECFEALQEKGFYPFQARILGMSL